MELSDLLSLIDERQETAPPPPIFTWSQLGQDFWREHFESPNGSEAWQRLCDHAGDSERSTAVVSTEAWEELLEQEKVRRAERLWNFSRRPNGSVRPDKEKAAMRQAEISACAGDLWHWLNQHGWIETPHAREATSRIAPLVYFPGQAALMWWLRDGIQVGRSDGSTCFRHLLKSRKVTASWSACLLLAHHFLFEPSFSAKLGSITGAEADDKTTYSLLGKLRYRARTEPSTLGRLSGGGVRRRKSPERISWQGLGR